MEQKNSDNFLYEVSRAIIKNLYLKGLISFEEFTRIDARNKTSFGAN